MFLPEDPTELLRISASNSADCSVGDNISFFSLWSADGSGEPVALRYDGPVNAVVLGPDSERFAIISGDKSLQVWQANGAGEPSFSGMKGK
jgi:WD40 repeat protein